MNRRPGRAQGRPQAGLHPPGGSVGVPVGRGANIQSGFTLIELMIVVALIAIASALASLALRDPASTQLEQEGARLAALLESARAEARASGLAVRWEPRPPAADQPGLASADNALPADFSFIGLPPSAALPQRWLARGVSADVVGARAVPLGPEPLIGAQRIVLSLNDRRLTLATDGLGPFVVVDDTSVPARW